MYTQTLSNSGSDVFITRSGDMKAVWVDGEKVFEYDDLFRDKLMELIGECADGNVATYGEGEALVDKRDMSYIGSSMPDSLDDIIFSDDVEVITIQDAEDLRENLQTSRKDYVIIQIRAGIVDEEMVRDYASDEMGRNIFDIQDRS